MSTFGHTLESSGGRGDLVFFKALRPLTPAAADLLTAFKDAYISRWGDKGMKTCPVRYRTTKPREK